VSATAEPAGRGLRRRGRAGRARPAGRPAGPAPTLSDVQIPRAGWRTVAAKEFADYLLSVRFLVLLAVLGLSAAGAVYAAAGSIREVAAEIGDVAYQSPFLLLFTSAPEGLPAFAFLIGFLGPLLGIAFGFDAINGERAEGTLPRLLSQPIHRDDVINGKFVAGLAIIALIFAAIVAIVAAVGVFQLGIVPRAEEVLRLVVWWMVAVVYVGLWLAFALLCSVLTRRAATSALVAMAVWLVLTLFATLLVGILAGALAPLTADAPSSQQLANAQLQDQLSRLSPGTLFNEATSALLDPSRRWVGLVLQSQLDRAFRLSFLGLDQSLLVIWPQVVALVGLTAVAFAAAYIAFMRQEVRA
jgi:ABC-2 type transport system permease protein